MTLAVDVTAGPLTPSADALAVPVRRGTEGPEPGAGADTLRALGVDVRAALERQEATGEPGEVVAVPVDHPTVRTVLLVGVGDSSARALRKAAAALARQAKVDTVATTLADGLDADAVRAAAEAAALAAYRFTAKKTDPKPAKPSRLTLVVSDPAAVRGAVDAAAVTARAVTLARDLTNTPSLDKTPQWMAEQAQAVATRSGLDVEVWDDTRLAADGFGGILAVGRGSARPPRLVRLDYRPAAGTGRHVVLVGKGITFDSGGLSLKPGDAMVSMKTDMAGGAAVIATMSALRDLGVRDRVTGLVPLAENMIGGDATRPSDVVRHYGGTTSEVLNTDAEGRLVLADALAYAVANLAPDAVVDIATLTGAASLGLGKRHAALYATSPALADALVRAGEAGGERLWPMPLVDDYRDALDSDVADLRNVADPGRHYSAGSIVAALFLREFVDGVPWAHLDVAGPARADADEDEVTKGATGFGVRTFLRWLAGQPSTDR